MIHTLGVEVDDAGVKVRWYCSCEQVGKWFVIAASVLIPKEWEYQHISRLALTVAEDDGTLTL